MNIINCRKLRLAVTVAVGLFILGVLLQVPRLALPTDFATLTTLFSGTGLLAMVLSPVLLVLVTVVSLFPGISRQLHLCEH